MSTNPNRGPKQSRRGRALADRISRVAFSAHRGVYFTDDGVIVAFGNDGYSQDERARREVQAALAYAADCGLELDSFGTDRADGYTWALRFRAGECPQMFEQGADEWLESVSAGLHNAIWGAWGGEGAEAGLYRAAQSAIAEGTILRSLMG